MVEVAKENDVMLLFDSFNLYSQDLYHSFQTAGYEYPAVVIEDDGFLPDGIMSVFGYFLGDYKDSQTCPGRPLFFNEVTVPAYWEITSSNQYGQIMNKSKERGRIFYTEPTHLRLVKEVDWLSEKGTVLIAEQYNKYGAMYARTLFNGEGHRVTKTYFSATGQEVIVENFSTGDIILNSGKEILVFRTKTDFVLHFIKVAQFKQTRMYFNSLSTPFFVSQRLKSERKRDVLFWQEPVRDSIPGNMQMILNGQATRTEQIMVQMQDSYDRLLELGADQKMVSKLGFIYDFVKENKRKKEALICTNSDQIAHLEDLVKALPELHFHVAAITEMSSKLMGLGTYDNVSLYPGVKENALDKLFMKCDYYLDINYESEIVSAVRKAFLHNQLIFAFRETQHNKDYVAKEHIFMAAEHEKLAAALKEVLTSRKALEEGLILQHQAALSESPESYQSVGI